MLPTNDMHVYLGVNMMCTLLFFLSYLEFAGDFFQKWAVINKTPRILPIWTGSLPCLGISST